MHKAQPLTIGSNLLTEIEQFGLTDELPSPFELMRLKRDADKLLKISAVESYVVKAGIAALEWVFAIYKAGFYPCGARADGNLVAFDPRVLT